jgi:hypothetical protein
MKKDKQARAEFARLARFLIGKGFRKCPVSGSWRKWNIVCEKGQGGFNLYRGENGAAHWNVTAEKVKQLLAAG